MTLEKIEELFSKNNYEEIIKISENIDFPEKNERLNELTAISYLELGKLEKNLRGNDDKALDYFKKSRENKKFPDTYNEIGLIHLNGNIENRDMNKAEEAFDRSIELDSNYLPAILNKGITLEREQRFDDCIKTYLLPFKVEDKYNLDPKFEYFEIIANKIVLAISYIARRDSNLTDFYMNLLLFLIKNVADPEIKKNASESFKVCLRNESKKLIINNLINEYVLEVEKKEILNNDNENLINLDNASPKKILDNNHIIEYLNSNIVNYSLNEYRVSDYLSEKLLSSLRSIILQEISKNNNTNDLSFLIPFLLSLSKQSYLNEYCWFQSNDEYDLVKKLYSEIIKKIENNIKIELYEILILNSYKSLNELNEIDKFLVDNFKNSEISELIELQIINKKNEKKFSKNIEKLGSIKNKISILVKNQYEENPYPRWEYISKIIPREYKKYVSDLISPNKIVYNNEEANIDIKKVLIAGCGTGRQPIEIALMDPSLKIDALDISLASLSYGMRKAKEMNIENIRWIHGDILELKNSNYNYDAIESSGVIHHMEDPSEGFRILESNLKSKGIMNLGLYSRLSKRKLVEAKKFLNKNKHINKEFIREARNLIGFSKAESLKSCMQYTDFYTSSEFKDLLLHEQEHFISIPELKNLISKNFIFLGFHLKDNVKHKIIDLYNKTNQPINFTSLDFFNNLEEEFNDLFDNMYNFFIMKK
tara:strand:+ start:89 stop:2215 length:2127 start_codon:yes stop_codon:yes gene_type:complete